MASAVGIIINIILLILLIVLVIAGLMFNKSLGECENQQSANCFTITCPCDNPGPPCYGNAFRAGSDANTFYCINAPNTLVNEKGQIVGQ